MDNFSDCYLNYEPESPDPSVDPAYESYDPPSTSNPKKSFDNTFSYYGSTSPVPRTTKPLEEDIFSKPSSSKEPTKRKLDTMETLSKEPPKRKLDTMETSYPLLKSERRRQVFYHPKNTAVLCISGFSYTLSNGYMSLCEDYNPNWKHQLIEDLTEMNIGKVYALDVETKRKYLQAVKNQRKFATVILLDNVGNLSKCTFCRDSMCHRWRAIIGGIQKLFNWVVEPIRH